MITDPQATVPLPSGEPAAHSSRFVTSLEQGGGIAGVARSAFDTPILRCDAAYQRLLPAEDAPSAASAQWPLRPRNHPSSTRNGAMARPGGFEPPTF